MSAKFDVTFEWHKPSENSANFSRYSEDRVRGAFGDFISNVLQSASEHGEASVTVIIRRQGDRTEPAKTPPVVEPNK